MNFLKTGLGVFVSQVISLLLIPILSRIYAPSEFAELGYFLGLFAIVAPICSLRLSDAIVVAKYQRSAHALFELSILICALLSVVVGGGIYLFSGDEKIAIYMILMIISYTGIQRSLFWLIRSSKFGSYSILNATMTALVPIFQLSFYYLGYFGGLLDATLVSYLLVALIGNFYCYKMTPKRNLSIYIMIYSLKKQSKFIKYLTPYSIVGSLKQKIPYILLGSDSNVTGYLMQADRIMNAPNSLLSSAIRPVLYRFYSNNGVNQKNAHFVETIVKFIVVIVAPIVALMIFNSEKFVIVVLGKEWAGASNIFSLVIISSGFFMITNWMDRLLDVMSQQKIGLIIESIMSMIIVLSLLSFSALIDSGHAIVLLYTVLMIIGSLIWLSTMYYFIGLGVSKLVNTLIFIFTISVVSYMMNIFLINSEYYLSIYSSCYVSVVLLFLFSYKNKLLEVARV
ncbi:TPA: oligosaccharide flippase family protein [Vibrio mimicus]